MVGIHVDSNHSEIISKALPCVTSKSISGSSLDSKLQQMSKVKALGHEKNQACLDCKEHCLGLKNPGMNPLSSTGCG